MRIFRLTPNRIIAFSNLLRRGEADGVMRVERLFEESGWGIEDRYSVDRPMRMKTVISVELEVYGSGLDFLEEDGLLQDDPPILSPIHLSPIQAEQAYQEFAVPKVQPPPPPPPIDYKPSMELFVKIVEVIVRAWASDDNKIRFGLLELD